MTEISLIACPECDALLRKPALRKRQKARCPRCGATLYQGATARLERICAVTLAALVTFLIAQAFPVIELEMNGITTRTGLLGALGVLWNEGMQLVAALVFCATTLFPLVELLALLYVLLPMRRGHVPYGFHLVMRALRFVKPWSMLEVFMLGALVTMTKMTSIARVVPETALFAFGALTLMFTVVASFDARTLWDIADALRAKNARASAGDVDDVDVAADHDATSHAASCLARLPEPAEHVEHHQACSTVSPSASACLSASRAGLIACEVCGHVQQGQQEQQVQQNDDHADAAAPLHARHVRHAWHHSWPSWRAWQGRHGGHCARCGAALHQRRPNSLSRTWALMIAAALLYLPANLLPVMHTASLLGSEDDTIMSGVVYFWTSGDWPLATIVFVASILVPMLKLSVLALLAITCQRRSAWRCAERSRLYRLIEFIGRWSMLDVFVITLTVALVRFQSLAVITAGPGAMAFGAVVVLTMLAALEFDPRFIWDDANNET